MRTIQARSISEQKETADSTAAWAARALLVVLTLVVYSNAFGLGLALDGSTIVADQRTHAVTLENLKLIFTTNTSWPNPTELAYRPLTLVSFLLNYAVLGGGADPLGYHALNILLHIGNVLLVFALARRLFGAVWPAALGAALWAVHPVGPDAVTNLAGRPELLATAGILGALLCFDQGSSPRWRIGLGLCAALAVFSHETGAILIGLMLLWDGIPGARRRWVDYVVAAAPLVLYLALRIAVFSRNVQPILPFLDNPLRGAGFGAARWTALKILALDLGILVWPAGLTADRSFDQIPLAGPGDAVAWVGLAAALVVIAIVLWKRNEEPLWLWAAGFFGLALLPSSNLLMPAGSPMAERYLYLPAIALAILAASLAYRFVPARASAVLALLILLCGARTFARNPVWNDNSTLAAHDLRYSPRSVRLMELNGELLFAADQGNINAAIANLEKAWNLLSAVPPERSNPAVPLALGSYYLFKGDQAGARTPEGQAWYGRGVAVLERAGEIALAIQESTDANLARHGKPPSPKLPQQRVFMTLGDGYRAVGRNREAVEAYRRAREIAPTEPAAYDNAASALVGLAEWPAAAILEIEKSLIVGVSREPIAVLAQIYRQIPGGECAVLMPTRKLVSLNPDCPRLRMDVCGAYADLVRTFTAARDPQSAAGLETAAARDWSCRVR